MSGTVAGGKKAALKNIASDPDFYSRIAKKGKGVSRKSGFYGNSERAREVGKLGGRPKGQPWTDEQKQHQSEAMLRHFAKDPKARIRRSLILRLSHLERRQRLQTDLPGYLHDKQFLLDKLAKLSEGVH